MIEFVPLPMTTVERNLAKPVAGLAVTYSNV
jgi:hypothetical protein